MRQVVRKIIHWSRAVKVGGALVSLFWFLQFIRDEFLPEDLGARMRLLNLLPHFHWYGWVILLLCVWIIGMFEGVVRWHNNEVAPILGLPGTLQHEAVALAGRMRDFIKRFVSENGLMPPVHPTTDEKERAQMAAASTAWGMKFSRQFRVELYDEVCAMAEKIRARGIPVDFSTEGNLTQALLSPNFVLLSAGILMAGGLALSLSKSN